MAKLESHPKTTKDDQLDCCCGSNVDVKITAGNNDANKWIDTFGFDHSVVKVDPDRNTTGADGDQATFKIVCTGTAVQIT